MRHLFIFVGRRAQDPLLAAADDYLARLQRMCEATLARVRPAGSQAEGKQILQALHPYSQLVVLDGDGAAWSSPQLAAFIDSAQARGVRELAWAVGGADGIAASVRARSHAQWCLGPLTLPHRLAQVLALEQIYRAHASLAGRPYHHGERPGS